MTDIDIGRGRRAFLAVAALFFLPLAGAFYLYYKGGWRPQRSTNHGELITPARPLPELPLTLAEGQAVTTGVLKGKWTLAFVGTGSCDANCRDALVMMRQVRLTLANEMTRVQRAFIVTKACCDAAYLSAEHPGLITVNLDAATSAPPTALLSDFPVVDREHSIFIIDPLGNLMMRYDDRLGPKGLKTDLLRLLKLSSIG